VNVGLYCVLVRLQPSTQSQCIAWLWLELVSATCRGLMNHLYAKLSEQQPMLLLSIGVGI
jgi:hypothetical protein